MLSGRNILGYYILNIKIYSNYRLSLRSGKPYVPEKIIGTLTSNILKSIHTLISLIFSYKLYSVATLGHPETLPLENHVRIIALTPDL